MKKNNPAPSGTMISTKSQRQAESCWKTLMEDYANIDSMMVFSGNLMNMKSHRRRRFRAWLTVKQGFRCCMCKGCLTLAVNARGGRTGLPFDNYATFEHHEDVFTTGRTKNDSTEKIGVACYECNKQRGVEQLDRALRFYGNMFASPRTLYRFLQTKKVAWVDIWREFGPIPPDFV